MDLKKNIPGLLSLTKTKTKVYFNHTINKLYTYIDSIYYVCDEIQCVSREHDDIFTKYLAMFTLELHN